MAIQYHMNEVEDASSFLQVPENTPTTIPGTPINTVATAGSSLDSLPTAGLNGEYWEAVTQLQKSLSAISLDRASEGEKENGGEENTTYKLAFDLDSPITIGISGATSAGKTTLAIILAEIFTSEIKDAPSYLGSNIGSSSAENGNMVICQDSFFFHKGACEQVSFPSKPVDISFCQESTKRDEINEYVISHESIDKYKISGPDTDHPSAVNFWGLLKAVTFAKKEGQLPAIGLMDAGGREEFGSPVMARLTKDQIDDIKTKYNGVISRSKQVLANWAKWQSGRNARSGFEGHVVRKPETSGKLIISPKFLFLEGFLLYDKLTPNTPIEDSDTEDEATRSKKNFAYGRMGMYTEVEKQKQEDDLAQFLLSDLEKKFQRGEHWEDAEIEYIQEHHYLAMKRAMKQLMPLIDIKLFLTTSKEESRSRRFQRQAYIDEPLGLRKPGQMWKTEGYFEHVAWKNHILHHNWLIDFKGNALPSVEAGDDKAEIQVRDPADAGVGDTVEWAVTRILLKLSDMEDAVCKSKMI